MTMVDCDWGVVAVAEAWLLWEAVLVVAVVGLWFVFVFVFLVDGGTRMWVWVVMRLWVWVCDFGGWRLWWLPVGGFFF